MQYRPLGHSGISVSALSLGSWQTFESIDEVAGVRTMSAALDAGITFLDDARYDDRTGQAPLETGYSEVVFGRLLRKAGVARERLILANKLWFEFYPEQSIAGELEGSLARIETDYLDLMYVATPELPLPMEELVTQLQTLIQAGKMRAWGVLNWPAERIEEAHRCAQSLGAPAPVAAQLPYSIVRRKPVESERMRRICAATGVSAVASASLAGGLLTGKYDRASVPSGARLDAADLARLVERGALEAARQVSAIAREIGVAPAQLALAFCLKNPDICSLLFGAKSEAQVRENVASLALIERLDAETMARLRAISSPASA